MSKGNPTFYVAAFLSLAAGVVATQSQSSAQQRAQRDAVNEAQTTQPVTPQRPEQQTTEHDRSAVFDAANAQPTSPVFKAQPKAVVAQLELVASERRSPVYQIHIVHRAFAPWAASATPSQTEALPSAYAVPQVDRVPAPQARIVQPASIPNKMISSSPPAPRGPSASGIRRK